MSHGQLERVIAYHDATKHHPHRYARSLGYLDWDTQPDPFRRYAGSELIRLRIPPSDPSPPYEAIYTPGAVTPAPLDFDSVSLFFYLSLAISAWKQAGRSRWALRCNPSSGNLHPTEGYAILPPMEGLGPDAGVYHYAPREHGLERRAGMEQDTWRALVAPYPPGTFLVGLSSVHWREAWKYGERAFRYCQHDAGHALGALRIAAAALGWNLAVLEELSDDDVARLLGLDRRSDFAEAEPEHPEMIAVVYSPAARTETAGPRSFAPPPLDPAAVEAAAAATWFGRANRLSTDHIHWPIIEDVSNATRKPATARAPTSPPLHPEEAGRPPARVAPAPGEVGRQAPPPPDKAGQQPGGSASPASRAMTADSRAGPTAMQIIRQRRSALAFNGRTSITAGSFYHMLGRVLPTRPSPDDDTAGSEAGEETQGKDQEIEEGEHRHRGLEPGTASLHLSAAPSLHPSTSPPLHLSRQVPFDSTAWPPRIDLLLFVHLVDELPRGLYTLVRDPGRLDRLRADMKPEFAWSRPADCPPGLPLYFLLDADCRQAAAQLSLGQEIAGLSAFSLAMIADFEPALVQEHPWYYRALHWEAGLVGQVLYLEAEAAGIRSTGIGAYFDDLVHEVMGLQGHGFQSLYHFTVGGHVEDPRLTTLPSYPPPLG